MPGDQPPIGDLNQFLPPADSEAGHPLASMRILLERINNADRELAEPPFPTPAQRNQIVATADRLCERLVLEASRLRAQLKRPALYPPLGRANRTPP